MGKIKKAPEVEKYVGVDHDLRTKIHDEMMLWLDTAVPVFLSKWISSGRNWEVKDLYYSNKIDKNKYDLDALPEKPAIRIISKQWEYPILRGSNTLVAVPDMLVIYEYPTVYIAESGGILKYDIDIEKRHAWFEVKSKIDSYGETLRQLSIYKSFSRLSFDRIKSDWFLVAPRPEVAFVRVLNEQGIGFIEYSKNIIEQDEYEIDGVVRKIPAVDLSMYSEIEFRIG